ncbi:aldose epimerase family protein [Oceanirhabdus seepicola]|uniref:Aldose 1-epimerase n=1 Tax=Oceanirhabdus seepicola TaxID=2828781 RepID=A0A9J6NWH7_9CLOT|nr:aldose epimerase family protein [Oceanirhabdus seepicola]MCM1988366.1 galactose mutarotase [Oceanirhabdus seepicola]
MKTIKKSVFGKLKSGEEVLEFELINKNNIKVKVLNYGGIIREIITPGKDGKFENIVLGFDTISEYEEQSPYFGCIVGRSAGRISKGRFEIDGQEYRLAQNNGVNNLHGGNKGFDKAIWDTKNLIDEDSVSLVLNYLSVDGEEGFPGNLKTQVTYTLTDQNEFEIKFSGVSDKKTLINLTNHTYFNLSGNLKDNILNHKLTLKADNVIYVDDQTIPTGVIADVKGGVFDFTEEKKIGEDINKQEEQLLNCGGYDHPWVFNKSKIAQIKLEDEKSGRGMEISTDQPVVVIYASNQMGDELILSGGRESERNLGVCLETQDYPDAINQPSFPCKVYESGEVYTACTKYKFFNC